MAISTCKRELKKLEWSGYVSGQGSGPHGSGGDGRGYSACPVCYGLKVRNNEFNDTAVGHRSWCTLSKTLRSKED